MNKIPFLITLLVLSAVVPLCAQEIVGGRQDTATSTAVVRYEPASGTSHWIRLKAPDGTTVKVGEEFVTVDKNFAKRLKHRSSAIFSYEVVPTGQPDHYIVRSHTRKNSFGFSGSYLFYGDFTHHRDWLLDEYSADFEGATFGLRDFSVGLLYARQLCAKNRHRLSVEILPAYRQIRQTFVTDRYTTSFPATDPDGYDYERLVTVNDYNESLISHCASFQLDFRYDWYFLKYLSLFVTAGIDNLLVVSQSSDVSFGATYAGRYGDDLFNTVVDENGYYDFGTFPDNHIETDAEKALQYKLYGAASAGLQICIGPVLSLEVAGVYHRLLFSQSSGDAEKAFCLSESAGNYQSMSRTMKPAAQNRLGVNVKLKFNF
jgi:hypothetical protein